MVMDVQGQGMCTQVFGFEVSGFGRGQHGDLHVSSRYILP